MAMDAGRIEFRVICRHKDGSDMRWKTAASLEDAIEYVNALDSRFRAEREWFIYEVTINEAAKIVHRFEKLS